MMICVDLVETPNSHAAAQIRSPIDVNATQEVLFSGEAVSTMLSYVKRITPNFQSR